MKGRTSEAKAYARKVARFVVQLAQKDGIERISSAFYDMTHIYVDWRGMPFTSYTDIGDDGTVDVVYYFGQGVPKTHVVLDRRQNHQQTVCPEDDIHFRGMGRAPEFQSAYDEVRTAYQEQEAAKEAR